MLPFGPNFFFWPLHSHSQFGRCIKVLSPDRSSRLPTQQDENPAELAGALTKEFS